MSESIERILKELGIGLIVRLDGHELGSGQVWEVTMPPPGKWSRNHRSRKNVFAWLASWADSEYSEYLAIQYFRDELKNCDEDNLDQVEDWLENNRLTDYVVRLRAKVDGIVLESDLVFDPAPDLIVSILQERVGQPYLSLGARMMSALKLERHKRTL